MHLLFPCSLSPDSFTFYCLQDLISEIRDPEKAASLEDLNVVSEEGVKVKRLMTGQVLASIEFVPTVPHCTLASIIGKIIIFFCAGQLTNHNLVSL